MATERNRGTYGYLYARLQSRAKSGELDAREPGVEAEEM